MIGEIFDATNDTASARSVYVALTQIASDEQSESFTRSIGDIAKMAGVSYKTAARILSRFEALRILEVRRNVVEGTREHSPSTYTLGNHYLRLGNERLRPSLPRYKNNLRRNTRGGKNPKETRSASHAASATAPAAGSLLPNGFAELSPDEQEIINIYNRTMPSGWKRVTRVTDELRKALAARSLTEWKRLMTGIASDSPDDWPPRTRRTLIGTHWNNY